VDGTLDVTPAPLLLTADVQVKRFGTTLRFAGTEFTSAGLVNGDSVRSVRLASAGARKSATPAGNPYPIDISNAVGAGLSNYDITYAPGALFVVAPDVETTPPAAKLPPLVLPGIVKPISIVFTDQEPGSGGPSLGVGQTSLAAAEGALAFVVQASQALEAKVANCDTAELSFDGELACLRDALDLYGADLGARIVDLPEPLRRVTAVIEQATRRIETARVTAARRMQTAGTPEEARAIEAEAVAEAQAAVGEAVEEIRKAIELIRADEPQVARLQVEQGVAITAALESVEVGLARAVGL
jgi:hypothetical protein